MSLIPPKFINYFQDFSLWTKIHYYAFLNRKQYPNLFFFYFPYSGILIEGLIQNERNAILTFMKENKQMINGLWGYLSLILQNKNGLEVYSIISKSQFFEASISYPCIQNKLWDHPGIIKDKANNIFNDYETKYNNVISEFEFYLDHSSIGKVNEYRLFVSRFSNKVLFSYEPKDIIALMQDRDSQCDKDNDNHIKNSKKKERTKTYSNSNNSEIVKSSMMMSNNRELRQRKKKEVIEEESSEGYISNDDSDYNELEIITNKESNDLNYNYHTIYLEHEQKLDGYNSDYTKNIFHQKPRYCLSDNESVKQPKIPRKIHRVKVKGKSILKNIKLNHHYDEDNFGIKSYEVTNYEKLKRELLKQKTTHLKRCKIKANAQSKNEIGSNKKKNLQYEANLQSSSKKKKKLGNTICNHNENNSLCISNNNNQSSITNQSYSKKKLIDDIYYHSSKKKSKPASLYISSNYSHSNNNNNVKEKDTMSLKSFSSLLSDKGSNNNNNQKKKRIKRDNQSIKSDTSKNQTIKSFIPVISNASLARERKVLQSISKLVNNSRIDSLMNIYQHKRSKVDIINNKIRSIRSHFISSSNDIDQDIITNIIQHSGVYSFTLSTNNTASTTIDININTLEGIKALFVYYKDCIGEFFSLTKPNQHNNSNHDINIDNEKKLLLNLKSAEDLIKYSIINLSNDLLVNLIVEIADLYLQFLSILVNIILFTQNDISISSFSLLSYTFIFIIHTFLTKEGNNNNSSMNNHHNTQISIIKEMTIKFIQTFNFIILIKIFLIDDTIIQSEVNDDILSIISLFSLNAELYFNLNDNSNNKNNFNHASQTECQYNMMKSLSEIYFNINNTIDTQSQGSIVDIVINDLMKYISPTITYVNKKLFEDNLKGHLLKLFIYISFDLDNSESISIDLKNIITNKILLSLFQRYLYIFFLLFVDDINANPSFILYYEILIKQNEKGPESYYDSESLLNQICQIGNVKVKREPNLIQYYLLSDSKLLLILQQNWLIETKIILSVIFALFSIINYPNRKSKVIDSRIVTIELFKLIPIVFYTNESKANDDTVNQLSDMNYPLIELLYNISLCTLNIFKQIETDEKSRKKFFSKYLSYINPYKANILEANDSMYKLGIIPVFSIILTFIQFANKFLYKENIDIVLLKIKDLIDNDKMRTILKSFNLSIWLKIIQTVSSKKIDIDISKYIALANDTIKQMIQTYIKYELLPECDSSNKIMISNRQEVGESILNYLNNMKSIIIESPQICLNCLSMLDEMKEMVNLNNPIGIKFRIEVINLLSLLIDKFEEGVKSQIIIDKEEVIDLGDGDIVMISFDDILNGIDNDRNLNNANENAQIDDLNQTQIDFLFYTKRNYIPLIELIIRNFITKKNYNCTIGKRVTYSLYESTSILHSKLYGLFTKYNIDTKPFDYFIKTIKTNPLLLSNQFNQLIESSDVKSIYHLQFKLLSIYINTNNTLIHNQIRKREYKATIQYFIYFFFLGLITKPNQTYLLNHSTGTLNKYYINTSNDYCKEFINIINSVLSRIDQSLNEVRKDIDVNHGIITERNREESSYYNLLKCIGDINIVTDLDYYTIIKFIMINTSHLKNIEMVETRFLFGILNNDIIQNGLRIFLSSSSTNIVNDINKRIDKVNYYILEKYMNDYVKLSLDNNTNEYIDNYIKSICNSQENFNEYINRHMFILFINNLLQFRNTQSEVSKLLLTSMTKEVIQRVNGLLSQLYLKKKIGFILSKEDIDININNNAISFNALIDYFPLMNQNVLNEVMILLYIIALSQILHNKDSIEEINTDTLCLLRKVTIKGLINNIKTFYLSYFLLEKLIGVIRIQIMNCFVLFNIDLILLIERLYEEVTNYAFYLCLDQALSIIESKIQKQLLHYNHLQMWNIALNENETFDYNFKRDFPEVIYNVIRNNIQLSIFLKDIFISNSIEYERIIFFEYVNMSIYRKFQLTNIKKFDLSIEKLFDFNISI